MFEKDLNIRSCYVILCNIITIESQYLKPKLKNERSTIGILGAIALKENALTNFYIRKVV